MFVFRKWFKRFLVVVFVGFLVFSFALSQSALGQVDECVLQPKGAWQNKFPIGFVAGTVPTTTYFTDCPVFKLFGYEYKVCAVKTLLQMLKNIVLLKFIITSLQNL